MSTRFNKAVRRSRSVGALLALSLAGCAAEGPDQGLDEVASSRQAVVDAMNGLRSINGLTAVNGLKAVNGLRTRNGLKTVNGLTTINGLKTANGLRSINGLETVNGLRAINGLKSVNGLRTINGLTVTPSGEVVDEQADLPVDCGVEGAVGVDCWGYPDGLLNPITGMMRSDDGIMTAKYLIRCALPASDTVGVVDYTGTVIRMQGELGLAPEWSEGDCGIACQENVSACLMALTNNLGNHVEVELSSTANALGGGHSPEFPYQEAVFYGNLFLDTPKAHFCVGKDYAPKWWPGTYPSLFTTLSQQVLNRACAALNDCPFVEDNACNQYGGFFPPPPPAQCSWVTKQTVCTRGWFGKDTCVDKNVTIDSAVTCSGKDYVWKYPITTYRKEKGPQ